MIDLIDLRKTYTSSQGSVEALNGVSLHVERADIYGIIGYSGAGKSTLVRCINLLEQPDSGRVVVGGQEITGLRERELRKARQKIGMIFQHFNLLRSCTVFQNAAFPLTHSGLSKKQICEKVEGLLELVGLSDKRNAYPSQLSGGQKQRVAIARALASDPQVLLSDEATSALDPQTTSSILSLLSDLNRKLGLTIVLITHEMQVIKAICNKVAVLDNGLIVEKGTVLDIFSNPQHKTTVEFVSSLFQTDKINTLLENPSVSDLLKNQGVLVRLLFTGISANEAYISTISRRFEIDVSVIFGNIEIVQLQPVGSLFVIMTGDLDRISAAILYLQQENVQVTFIRGRELLAEKEAM